MPDIEPLRRFSLLIALALIFYAGAGISLEPNAKASVLGIPFVVTNPDLFLVGLIIASIYGLTRFFYYAIMLKHSPYRVRKDLLSELRVQGSGKRAGIYFGSDSFETSPMHYDYDFVKDQIRSISESFPKVGSKRVTGRVKHHEIEMDGGKRENYYQAEIQIPITCRVAAMVQDLDYTAPIWANIVGMLLVIFVER